jgi:hypothetical protein
MIVQVTWTFVMLLVPTVPAPLATVQISVGLVGCDKTVTL